MKKPILEPLGDQAMLVTLGDAGDREAAVAAASFSKAVMEMAWPGLLECVPAYASFAVYYDPAAVIAGSGIRAAASMRVSAYALVQARILSAWEGFRGTGRASGKLVVIPVKYGDEEGPDLQEVARSTGLSVEEVVQLHASREYTVQAIGFAPGFPYMSGLDPLLAVPRKDTPRTRVAAGSIGIAGLQTGIYPIASPGGWNIIGRTPRALFHLERRPPALLEPGDRVRFEPVDQRECSLEEEKHGG
ncbi:5-oxoprolinase subunit PxpB [Xylanibacillus composti]|uniref:Kinase A inhibitor n=1 Tax=Xylanibacillus composti TaxID=1572762 RepID=A0A8J4H4S1_9BACL|nr:5-oxoprolinase subunit PxpB [Xylanibacillus composti]GIQ70948.1 kinase A inhibitor [Xylanibacillus composti]